MVFRSYNFTDPGVFCRPSYCTLSLSDTITADTAPCATLIKHLRQTVPFGNNVTLLFVRLSLNRLTGPALCFSSLTSVAESCSFPDQMPQESHQKQNQFSIFTLRFMCFCFELITESIYFCYVVKLLFGRCFVGSYSFKDFYYV